MKEQFKDFFYFSRGEKNGILVLLGVLLVLITVPFIIPIFSENKPYVNQHYASEIELFNQSLKIVEEPEYNNRLNQIIIERYDSLTLFYFNPNITSAEKYKKLGLTDKQITTIFNYLNKGGKFYIKDDFKKIYGIRNQQYQILKPYILLPEKEQNTNYNSASIKERGSKSDSLFVFDPNKATNDEFLNLGLSQKQTNVIRNYLSKGGHFRDKEDFKKIYGISPEQYAQLEPYIFIKSENKNEKEPDLLQIEINQATIAQLTEIKGIGSQSAKAIINYRNKIGGFVRIEQILEIKYISENNYNLFKNQLVADAKNISQLSLNFSEVNEFAAHPYLNYYQAKEIVNFRTRNGPYQSKKQLLENKILLEQSFNKIEPYLSLN